MKTYLLLIPMMLFVASAIFGQRITPERLAVLTEDSDIIVEGKVIDATTYRNDSDGYIYTEYHLKVSRVAKDMEWLDEERIVKFSVPGGVYEDRSHVTHNAYFDIESNGIFFLKALPVHNYQRLGLTQRHNGVLLYGNYKSIYDVMHVKFGVRQIKQLLSDIEKILGQTFSKLGLNSAEESVAIFLRNERIEANNGRNLTETVYVIVSGITLTVNSDSVKFYISLLSLNDELKYSKSDLRLSYNTDSFGEYVDTNEKIESEVKDFAEDISHLEEVFDQAADIVRLKLDIDVTELEQYPDFSGGVDLLYEVKVKIDDISELIDNLEDFYINGEVYYKDGLRDKLFDNVRFVFGHPFGALPEITDVYPLNITAGTQSILTIKGSNFTSDYRIFMRNGGGGSTTLVEIRSEDITWTENLITIELPSDATELDGSTLPTSGREPAGSGPVILTDNVNTITSNEIVNVNYAIINIRYPDTVTQARMTHADGNGQEGFTWKMHQNMSALNSDASACIKQAFCDFNQVCGMQYQLDNTEHTGSVIGDDNINTIGFVSDDPSFTVPGQTFYTGLLACNDASANPRAYVDEMDIRINNDGLRTWDFDCGRTNTIGELNHDFFTVLKHEVGHSIMLGHYVKLPEFPINIQPIVYYTVIQGEVNNEIEESDVNALNNVMKYDTTGIWGGGCPDRVDIGYFEDCDVLNSTIEHFANNNAKDYYSIFPNPSSGKLYVKPLDVVNAEPIERIEVYDMTGQLLMMTDRSSSEKELEIDLSFIANSQLITLRIITSKNDYNGLVTVIK